MTTLKILILCFLTLWISLPGVGGVAPSHACFAPPKSCLLCTSNVMLDLDLQCHACCALSIPCTCYALSMLCLFCTLQHHACFAPSISCLFCICNVALFRTFQCTFLLHFQCVAHFTEFSIKLWYSTMMSDRKFGLCLESLSIIVSPLKVIMFNNINGTLRNVHFNNREWWWWRLLRKFTLVICVEKKHDQVKWICVADSWMLQEYFYWA
jgi:hypothetical protein